MAHCIMAHGWGPPPVWTDLTIENITFSQPVAGGNKIELEREGISVGT